ncbi:uncharacterized protein F54H12.2-like [Tiliqua scincoides]|uniref:uncharacterized protein F54H12.2-like n=1 Tax=Tiliqua scincoides TaxID=71010 RepID=UPI003461F733
MAFIHGYSEECTKSELDLFQIAPTQTSIEGSVYVEVPPLTAVTESSSLELFITGNGEDYLDLNNTLLYLRCKIVKKMGQLDVTLGDRLISQSNNCYPYRAFIESVLNYGEDALSSQFSAGTFYKDTPGEHDSVDLDGQNQGFIKRVGLTAESRKIELMGHLHADLFFQEKLLLNGLDVKIKLTWSKDRFCMMTDDANVRYKLKLLTASLFVKKVRVSPGVRLGHAEALLTATAKCPVDGVSMKVFSLLAGSRVSNQENLFLGQLPKMVVIGLVDNDAFSGIFSKNPFNFKHYDINFFAIYLSGYQIPTKPFQPDFQEGSCVREYMSLVYASGKHRKDKGLIVNREDFARGYTLFAFDLSPDQECGEHYSLFNTGNLRAEVRFARPLPQTVNMIVYGVFDNIIEINNQRNVLFDYM